MQFVNVRDFRSKSAEIWKKLSGQNDIVITLNGKPIAILAGVSENSLEESLSAIRRARAMQAVEAMQSRSRRLQTDRIGMNEINAEIKAVRKARSR